VDLELPLNRRTEPIDRNHLETVATIEGPLVLFHVGSQLMPFMDIGGETYSLYA
jgi:hypothetical protein